MLSAKPVEAAPPQPVGASLPPHPSSPPFHLVSGLSNFRDIGGWRTSTSPGTLPRRVRRGILFRGSDTNRVTPEGAEKLRQLGIETDFDLRSKQQIEKTGGYKDLPGIQRIWSPVFAEEEYTEEAAQRRYELYAAEGTDVRPHCIFHKTSDIDVMNAGNRHSIHGDSRRRRSNVPDFPFAHHLLCQRRLTTTGRLHALYYGE